MTICGPAITAQSGHTLRGPLTLGIILATPTLQCVYLDGRALHEYGIAAERDFGVEPGLGTGIVIWNPFDMGAGSDPWPRSP